MYGSSKILCISFHIVQSGKPDSISIRLSLWTIIESLSVTFVNLMSPWLENRWGGRLAGGCCFGTGWASLRWWWAIVFHFLGVCFSLCYFSPHLFTIFFSFYLLNYFYLNPRITSLIPFWSSTPSHQGAGGSERAAVWCFIAGWG